MPRPTRGVCPRPGCPHLKPCPTHGGNHTGRSPSRDRAAQHRFRQAVLTRDGHACTECGNTNDLRACHIQPLAHGGTYSPDNGVTRCGHCDRDTDPYAR
jgi:5-methylcytosine-specific restriction endonuclease McrA